MTKCICKDCSCTTEEIEAWRKAFTPKEDVLVKTVAEALRDHETQGEYDLDFLVGRRFYHDKCDVVPLLGRALDWIEARPHLTVLDIRYDNSSFEGYSESITVIAEEG